MRVLVYVLFYIRVCVDLLEEFWNVHLFMADFNCPLVSLCGWQDIKIQ